MENLQDTQIAARIARLVEAELPLLPDHLRSWVEAHRTRPTKISASTNPDGTQSVNVWLVTDHIGKSDASSRIVYDPATEMFGLVTLLENTLLWYMGPYGCLVETVQAI